MIEGVVIEVMLSKYVRGGRGGGMLDCWGVVLLVCERMGWPMPIDPQEWSDDLRSLLVIFRDNFNSGDWKVCDPVDGAVAFFGKAKSARHAGIVIGGGVLEIKEEGGPKWTEISRLGDEKIEYAKWVR